MERGSDETPLPRRSLPAGLQRFGEKRREFRLHAPHLALIAETAGGGEPPRRAPRPGEKAVRVPRKSLYRNRSFAMTSRVMISRGTIHSTASVAFE